MRVVAVMVVAVLSLRGVVAAQDEYMGGNPPPGEVSCGYKTSCSELGHYVLFNPEGGNDVPQRHDDCMICKSGNEIVAWTNCHTGTCTGSRLAAAIQEAMAADDVEALIFLAPYAPARIGYNFARGTIQVLGCTGDLVANLAVDRSFVSPAAVAVVRNRRATWFELAFNHIAAFALWA